jgi:hypothetical protein
MSMDLSSVADDNYFSNIPAATEAFTYAEIIVSPPHNIAGQSRSQTISPNQNYQHDQQSDEDTRATISEITTTARTETEVQHQRELEHARQIIANQQAEIQKLKIGSRESTNFLRSNFRKTTRRNARTKH